MRATLKSFCVLSVIACGIDPSSQAASPPQPMTQMPTSKHILRMSCGVTVEMTFNEETAELNCEWSPPPPYSLKTIKKIREEYEPWRNGIMTAWAQRNKKNVMLLSL